VTPTTYRVVRHDRSGEVWIFRVEADVLTGACGPMREREIPRELSGLSYDDHPDDLEWIIRSWEHFEVLASR
jgi:hypothetical protein